MAKHVPTSNPPGVNILYLQGNHVSYYHIHTHLVRKLRNRLTILLHRWVSVEINIFHDATKLMVNFSWAVCAWKVLLLRLSSTPLLLWWRSEFRQKGLKNSPRNETKWQESGMFAQQPSLLVFW